MSGGTGAPSRIIGGPVMLAASRLAWARTAEPKMSTGWTDDRVDDLKKLWAEGKSATEIAKLLKGNLTRNAVIGKVHRLGLSGRAAPAKPARAAKPPRVSMPARTKCSARGVVYNMPPDVPTPAARRAAFTVVPPTARPWEERERGQCSWPIATPEGVFSCCAPATGEGSVLARGYCEAHVKLGTVKPIKNKPPIDYLAPRRTGGAWA